METEAYCLAWEYACKRYIEEKVKSQIPGAKAGVDFLGSNAVCKETRAMFGGEGPCGQTILDATKTGRMTAPKNTKPVKGGSRGLKNSEYATFKKGEVVECAECGAKMKAPEDEEVNGLKCASCRALIWPGGKEPERHWLDRVGEKRRYTDYGWGPKDGGDCKGCKGEGRSHKCSKVVKPTKASKR